MELKQSDRLARLTNNDHMTTEISLGAELVRAWLTRHYVFVAAKLMVGNRTSNAFTTEAIERMKTATEWVAKASKWASNLPMAEDTIVRTRATLPVTCALSARFLALTCNVDALTLKLMRAQMVRSIDDDAYSRTFNTGMGHIGKVLELCRETDLSRRPRTTPRGSAASEERRNRAQA